MTRGERVIAFIERYCIVPEGSKVGQPLKLLPFQKRFILDVYDNPAGTSKAYLSIARKNGKTGLIAALVLAHVVGPEARQNSQIISGARSRDQAALVFNLAQKMVMLSPDLSKLCRCVESRKTIHGLPMNVEYRAISAEAGTAHGLSPVLAILDEVGQVKGPHDSFVEAIITSQGAYDDALLFAISTQAATDADLFSTWIDYAKTSGDKRVVCHVYEAPEECSVLDKDAWNAANPALGAFRSLKELETAAERASKAPSEENSFRWLYLNQRIEGTAPFVSKALWAGCAGEVAEDFDGAVSFGGLDLSSVSDLTAFVQVARVDGVWQVKPTFWLPSVGLSQKAERDRVPYVDWAKQGSLLTTPGPSVDYQYVAAAIYRMHVETPFRKIAFDRWKFQHLKPWLLEAGFHAEEVEGDEAIFVPFGQGFASMSPALDTLETLLLNKQLAHGGHPVLTMCAANATTQTDPAGNRKLSKAKSHGRIDGMVALAMAVAVAGADVPESRAEWSPWDDPNFSLVA